MSLLGFWLLVFGLFYALMAPLWVTTMYDVPTPLRNDSTPPVINLLILVTIWLPVLLVAFAVAGLLRAAIPARYVNTKEG